MHPTLNYSYQILWSHDDDEYVAICIELPGLSGLGATAAEALQELKTAIGGWLDYLKADGIAAPQPTGHRRVRPRP